MLCAVPCRGRLQEKWRSMRERYQREKRAEKDKKKSGSAATSSRPWQMMAILSFLAPYVKARATSSNMDMSVRDEENQGDQGQQQAGAGQQKGGSRNEEEAGAGEESEEELGAMQEVEVQEEYRLEREEAARQDKDQAPTRSRQAAHTRKHQAFQKEEITPFQAQLVTALQEENPKEEDEDVLFCRSIVPTLKRLTLKGIVQPFL